MILSTTSSRKPSIRYAYGVIPVLLVSESKLDPSHPSVVTVMTWGGKIERYNQEDIKTSMETPNESRIGRFKIPSPFVPRRNDIYWTVDGNFEKAVCFTFCAMEKELKQASMGYFFRTELEALAYIAGCHLNTQELQRSLQETL